MHITETLAIHDLALLHEASDTLILGDTHIGEEESLREQGVLVPQFGFKDLYRRTEDILSESQPGRIVLNGDVKHNFGRISEDEWDHVFTYVDLLDRYADITIVEGNHDVLLEPITKRIDVFVEPYVLLADVLVCHGHETVDQDAFREANTVVLGHEHPAIALRDGERTEHFKAFLKARLQGKTVVLMPSMNQLREGSNVLQEQLLSPYLQEVSLEDAETYIIGEDGEPRRFGTVGAVKEA